ncbi:reverse transcriptase domain-containing protein [Tanacetum coccineum]
MVGVEIFQERIDEERGLLNYQDEEFPISDDDYAISPSSIPRTPSYASPSNNEFLERWVTCLQRILDRWVRFVWISDQGSENLLPGFKDCSALLVDDGGEAVTSSECPHCNRLFCAQCKVSWHLGMDCKEYQSLIKKGEITRSDNMLMDLAKNKKWKRCPKCNFYVERTTGCEHIACRKEPVTSARSDSHRRSPQAQRTDVETRRRQQRQTPSRATSQYSESEDSEGGHWKSRSRRQKSNTHEDDLYQPWTCEERNPFTLRIRNFSLPRTRMPSHVKTYDGSGDPADHLKLFIRPQEQRSQDQRSGKLPSATKHIKDPWRYPHQAKRTESLRRFFMESKAPQRDKGPNGFRLPLTFIDSAERPLAAWSDSLAIKIVMKHTPLLLMNFRIFTSQAKKRGQAPERNKAIQEEVEKLVDAGIMKETSKILTSLPQGIATHLPEIDWKVETSVDKHEVEPQEVHFRNAGRNVFRLQSKHQRVKHFPEKADAAQLAHLREASRTCRKLNVKLASLNRFLVKSAEKSLPFFKTLKNCTKKSDFQWTPEAEEAFKQMKKLIAELPTLTAPREREELIIYLAAAKEAISAVLMTDREGRQIPVYFVSRTLRGPEVNYTPMEKLVLALLSASKRLKRYFQAHTVVVITSQPIKQLLSSSEISGRMLKWKFELEGYDIQYRPRTAIKGQILADFIVERPEDESPDELMAERSTT